MATSGSVDFNVTRDELIRSALRVIGQLDFRSDPSVPEYTTASQALNMMVKSWQNRNIGIWLNAQAILNLNTTSESYSLSSTGANCAYDSYRTDTSAAASTGDATIDVDSDADITDGDYIGIALDDGTMQWTTVNGVPAADTVTLTDVLTGDVNDSATVYNYTTKIDRPLSIIEARRRDSSGNDIPILMVSRNEYMDLSDKDSSGTPTQGYYDAQLGAGVLYLWPAPSSVETRIVFTAKVPVEDFDAAANNADFPVEWLEALKYNLAMRLIPEYMVMYQRSPREFKQISATQIALVREQAERSLSDAEQFDSEDTPTYLIPDIRGYYR